MMERLWYLSVYSPLAFGLLVGGFAIGVIGMTCWTVWAFWPRSGKK
jgi:hypothetical protein